MTGIGLGLTMYSSLESDLIKADQMIPDLKDHQDNIDIYIEEIETRKLET